MVVLDRLFSFGRQKKWSLVALNRWPSYTVKIVREFAGADSALVVSDEWSSDRGDRLSRFDSNLLCLMEKWVQIFKCKISHSSTKSLVPTLHKFTIQNFDLFFPFLEKTLCTYWLVNIWGGWKNIVPPESRIAFCRLFIVRVKTVCYE